MRGLDSAWHGPGCLCSSAGGLLSLMSLTLCYTMCKPTVCEEMKMANFLYGRVRRRGVLQVGGAGAGVPYGTPPTC